MEQSLQTQTDSDKSFRMSQNFDQCIQDCIDCYQHCMSCITHCLSLGGKHSEQSHITLMLECAEICNLSATLMELKGQFSHEHCQVCAKVCEACAASCREIGPDDKMMNECADMCLRCAESCRNMNQEHVA